MSILPILNVHNKGMKGGELYNGTWGMPLFSLPEGMSPSSSLTFYCDSVEKDNNGIECHKDELVPDGSCFLPTDTSGNGTPSDR